MSLGRLQEVVAAIFALSFDAVKSFTQVLYLRLSNRKMVQITDLPVEIIAKILTFMSAEDQAEMSQVCKMFYEANNIEYVWLRRCRQEFNIDASSSTLLCKEIYTKLLYGYGDLLGFWQPEISAYGGLLHVQYKDGTLIGTELFPLFGSNIKLPLGRKQQFFIALNSESQLEFKCVDAFYENHKGQIRKLGKNKFAFECRDANSHAFRHNDMIEMIAEETLDVLFPQDVNALGNDFHYQSQELLLMKHLVRCQYKNCFKYNRVFLPVKRTNVPIQPGVFQGTYGAHGMELIMLDYDGSTAKAVKVSGDPNVPAGKITFMAELNHSMHLGLEEQATMSRLESIIPVQVRYNSANDKEQPFKVPKDCLERFQEVPKSCRGRFFGSGQIAGHGFTNPSFTNGHWIIFDEDLFGFMWLDLLSLSMYYRVKEVAQ